MPTILSLPSDIFIVSMVKYLSSTTVWRLALTCKSMRNMAYHDELWKFLAQREWPEICSGEPQRNPFSALFPTCGN